MKPILTKAAAELGASPNMVWSVEDDSLIFRNRGREGTDPLFNPKDFRA